MSLRKAPRGVHHQLHTRMRPSSFPQIPPKWIEVLSFAHYRRPNTREVHSITYLSTARAPGIVQKHRVQIHHYFCPFHQEPLRWHLLFRSDFTPRNPSPRQLEADSMGYHHVEPRRAPGGRGRGVQPLRTPNCRHCGVQNTWGRGLRGRPDSTFRRAPLISGVTAGTPRL